jgi:hypothetical protein
MYKVKIIFLLKNKDDTTEWSHGWVDANTTEADELNALLDEYQKKEQATIDELKIGTKVVQALVDQVCDITDGKYQCGSCECYFNELDEQECPFCGSGNFVEGCIDEPEPNTEDKKCFNHCPKCDATDPDIEWHEKDWSGDAAWQNATCKKCGHEFSEVYEYAFTEQKHNR